VDFVLSSGDLVVDGRLRDNWIAEFFRPAQRLLNHIPVFVAIGNHERESVLFSQYLRTPGGRNWFSFDLCNIHMIALDSQLSYRPGSEQYAWLIKDLDDHKEAKWKFLILHHPPYSSGNHGSDLGPDGVPREDAIRMAREVLPGLVTEYGIEASFYGHDHIYERSQRDGSYYIVSGGGGAENHVDGGKKSNPYRQYFYSGLHYCVVTISGDTGHISAKTPNGKVFDEFDMAARAPNAQASVGRTAR